MVDSSAKYTKKGKSPSNHWPITCLCMTWKCLSGIIATKVSRHVAVYMSRDQKGVSSNPSGAKHQVRMWGVKASVVTVMIGALFEVTSKLGEWLQEIPGTISKISVQTTVILRTAKILYI